MERQPKVLATSATLNVQPVREKVSDAKSAKHPKGRSGFWCRTPFPGQPQSQIVLRH